MVVQLLQNSDSSVEIKVDGKTLDKGSSVKLKIGSKIDVGGQATYQVRPMRLPLQGLCIRRALPAPSGGESCLLSHMHQKLS